MPIQALFFDVGNTLLFRDMDTVLQPLHQMSIFPSLNLLNAVERRTKREFDTLVESHSGMDQGFWAIYYSHLLNELGIANESICADLVGRTRISANWSVIRPGTRETLLRLACDYHLGVISNADGKINEILRRCGIEDCFESITDSGLVGQEKPNPAIFEAAVRSLGVSAGNSLYLGDVYSVDYLGATGFGIHSVLFDVPGAYKDRGLPRVESLEEFEALLPHFCERTVSTPGS
jgi:putative hydrolase of the HAD superfamily